MLFTSDYDVYGDNPKSGDKLLDSVSTLASFLVNSWYVKHKCISTFYVEPYELNPFYRSEKATESSPTHTYMDTWVMNHWRMLGNTQ